MLEIQSIFQLKKEDRAVLTESSSPFISYEFLGFDNDLNNITQNAQLAFFNPKAGINYQFNNNNKIYAFAGIGNK